MFPLHVHEETNRKPWMIAAAVVGVIALVGGLMFAFKAHIVACDASHRTRGHRCSGSRRGFTSGAGGLG